MVTWKDGCIVLGGSHTHNIFSVDYEFGFLMMIKDDLTNMWAYKVSTPLTGSSFSIDSISFVASLASREKLYAVATNKDSNH